MWALGMAVGIIAIDLTQGYKADLMSYLFGSILTVPNQDLILMVMQVVGLIMVIALLTIPAAIAGKFFQEIKQMMLPASILGIIFTTTGLWLSYFFNLTSGATIILVAGIAYLLSLLVKQVPKGISL